MQLPYFGLGTAAGRLIIYHWEIIMKHEGRGVIRLNDMTDHGGQVISVSSGTVVMGTEAALADDVTFCPKCKGNFLIKPDGAGASHKGRPYAYDGDLTACGAQLISSI